MNACATHQVPRTTPVLNEMDFCVVDTETTGGSPAYNRIIEVSVFHYRDGIIYDRYRSLLNPGRPIPPWITSLTGIDDAMVKTAPVFADIAPALRAILEKGVFVGHNAMFDYGFLQHEFARLGETFDRPQLCTLKLARLLFPELPSRSLGFLCDHLLIDVWDRHRAYGDAEATVYLLKNELQKVAREHGVRTWAELDLFSTGGRLELPAGISYADLARLPDAPGTYVFRDAAGAVVHKGRVKSVLRRVKTFFSKGNQSEKAKRLRQTVKFIEAV